MTTAPSSSEQPSIGDRARELARVSRRAALEVGWPLANLQLRASALRRLPDLRPGGVTVVTVNYWSLLYVQTLVEAVRRFSPPDVEILVVDNASRDGSKAWLASRDDVRSIALPVNILHGRALDLAVMRCTTEFFIALDVDAFPIREGWMDVVLDPLREGATVAGGTLHSGAIDYAHPCFMAMRVSRFVEERHSFIEFRRNNRLVMDTGIAITQREGAHAHLVPATSVRGPGYTGTVYGDAVYHNFWSTRLRRSRSPVLVTLNDEASRAWDEAVAMYLGPTTADRPS